ncbi:MAG: ribosome recycling factor [Candidatus Magasanikbacteria bacterium]|nr:ribosome recycling factor [Candidatus Magasanikbacteria bacterium]
MFNLEKFTPDFKKISDHLKEELSHLRTGRANSAILDGVVVEAYGNKMSLKGVASITVPDPKTITIEPWDKGMLKEIEKAIIASNIGLNPVNDGKAIRLIMPPMTEEFRLDLIKVANQRLESSRISLRQLRDAIRDEIADEEKNKTMNEDQRFAFQEKLEKIMKEQNDSLREMAEEKQKDIMTI